MTKRLDLFTWHLRTCIGLCGILIICGCGYSDYELRLAETKKYWAYLDTVEQYLAQKWMGTDAQMELRVPKQFQLIPPPARIKHEDGTIEEPTVDPRQPDYINLKFPELFGAWEARFGVLKTDGSREEKKGYLYALSNYWQLGGEQASDAAQFLANLKTELSDRLQIAVSDERQETQPTGVPPYQPQAVFDVCDFKRKEIDGVNYNFEVYAKSNGSVMGVLVFVLPEGMEAPQELSKRVPLMLASFNFTREPPRAGVSKTAPAAASGAPAKGGF